MTGVLGILAFAVLFATFAVLAPSLGRKRCGGEGGSCGACGNADACERKEH